MIKNIIFDVGKVLIDWNPRLTMLELGFSDNDIAAIMSAIFDSGAWSEEDRGIISHEDMYDFLASKSPEHAAQIRLFYDHSMDSVKVMPYTHDWISSLKANGFNVYILSNFGAVAWNKAIELGAINFLHLTDGKLVSNEVNLIKPDPAIFHALLERFELCPEECVFLDDNLDNVKGAISVGIHGIHFTDYTSACNQLHILTGI